MTIVHINNINELNQVSGLPSCVIDFFADWCGPCRMIAPYYQQLAQSNPSITFCKVNVDAAKDVARACNIRCMPTFQLYSNNRLCKEVTGADRAALDDLVLMALYQ